MPPAHHPHHHHRPPHGPPGPHAARWFHNSEGDLTRDQVSTLLRTITESLTDQGTIELGDLSVPLPPSVYSIVRYELAPRGEKVVRIELKWFEEEDPAPLSPITALLP